MHGNLDAMLDVDALRPETLRLLTRDEFARMATAGVFDDDEHVELLRGVLVNMTKQGEPHARITAWLGRALDRALDDSYEVRQHTSYSATADSVPEPDVQVISRALRRQLPRAAFLLVEVSETTVRKDQTVKPPIYAENRCPEYWVIDIPNQAVWVHTEPTKQRYKSVVRLDANDVLRPRMLPGVAIPVADIPWWPPETKRSRRRAR